MRRARFVAFGLLACAPAHADGPIAQSRNVHAQTLTVCPYFGDGLIDAETRNASDFGPFDESVDATVSSFAATATSHVGQVSTIDGLDVTASGLVDAGFVAQDATVVTDARGVSRVRVDLDVSCPAVFNVDALLELQAADPDDGLGATRTCVRVLDADNVPVFERCLEKAGALPIDDAVHVDAGVWAIEVVAIGETTNELAGAEGHVSASFDVILDGRIAADLDDDGNVDVTDLLELIDAWGSCDCPADLDGTGAVDVADLLILLACWT